MKQRSSWFLFLVLATALLTAGSASAFVPLAPSPSSGQTLLPSEHPRGIRYLPVQPDRQAALSARGAWSDFLARYGDGWQVRWSESTGTPHIVWGEGLPLLPAGGADLATVERVCRQFVRRHGDLFQVDEAELVLNPRSVNLGRDKETWFVHFDRRLHGLPVYSSDVYFRFKFGRLVQFGSDSFPDLALSPVPALGADEALEISSADCGFDPATDQLVSAGDLLYFPVQRTVGEPLEYHLVWRTNIRQPQGPHNWYYYVDARDGGIVARWDHVFYEISGTVTGQVYNRTVIDPVSTVAFPNLQVDISGASSVFTDLAGFYTSPATGSHTVSTQLYGPYFNINNSAGADAAASQTGSGSGINFLWSDSNSTMAERSCYYSLSRVRTRAMAWINPPWFSSRLGANVNIADVCNAYWDGLTVNFFLAGGGCNNTGEIADVVYHEWGHGLDDNIGGIFDGASSEGWGDICGVVMTQSCQIGPYFHTSGTPVREVCTNFHFPEDTGEVHDEGRIIGSTNYDLMVYLQGTLGPLVGVEKLRELFWQHFYTSEHYLDDYDAYLVIDDDDGNLNNYTPNFNEINLAFYEHGLTERVIPSGVFFTHTPLGDTPNTTTPYEVVSLITSETSTLHTGALEVRYQVNGGAFTAVPLTATGNPDEFHGFIPAQPAGTNVGYYLYGEDDEGPGTLPNTAPATVFQFLVGFEPIFVDDMESGTNGWTHAQIATQDDWMLGSPGPNGYDPDSAFSGSSLWGNDLAPAGWNGDYYPNVHNYLRSPAIDCSGYTGVHLRYMRWLTVEEAIYDQATIYVNGTQVWQNQPNGNHIDTAWTIHDLDISALADDNPSVQVEFHMQSDGGLEFGGWNIDDFKLIGTSASPPSDTVSVNLSATPPSGTVPFTTQFSALLGNLTAESRRVAARIDVLTGGGSSFTNWRSGTTNLTPGGSFATNWNQPIPALGALLGDNVFTLLGVDVTPSPFNQPPYAPSGDTDVSAATVTATN